MIQKRSNNRAVQLRTDDDGKRTIDGYAAVWYRDGDEGTEYRLWTDLTERIDRGAFDRVLSESPDTCGLFNHDANNVLGRTTAGTARLSVDGTGLRYEIDLPDTQAGRDTATLIERGDVVGSSFSFTIKNKRFEKRTDQSDLVTITEIDGLYDVGPVTYPAYKATTTGTRSADEPDSRAEYESFLKRLAQRDERVKSIS